MGLRVVGAGLGRTGTHSLKLALERLLGAPCYHMFEVFEHMDHVPVWHEAIRGEPVDWNRLFAGYAAAVDWPASAFWYELSQEFPDALILLSVREDSETWWRSASATIFNRIVRGSVPPQMAEWHDMLLDLFRLRFTDRIEDRQAAVATYEAHNADVRRRADPGRLVEWRPGDGWGPLCRALGLPIPDEPFPHVNTTDEFLNRARDARSAIMGEDAPTSVTQPPPRG